MFDPVSGNRVVAFLPGDLLDFLDAEVQRTALSRSAIVRQALAARKATQHRAEAIDREMAAQHEGLY